MYVEIWYTFVIISVCHSASLCLYLCLYVSVCLPVCLSVRLSACASVCLRLSVRISLPSRLTGCSTHSCFNTNVPFDTAKHSSSLSKLPGSPHDLLGVSLSSSPLGKTINTDNLGLCSIKSIQT